MKSLGCAALLLLGSVSAFANPYTLFTCFTGDALSHIEIGGQTDFSQSPPTHMMVRLDLYSQEDGAAPTSYEIPSADIKVIDALLASNDFTLELPSAKSFVFGGAISNAALITLSKSAASEKISGLNYNYIGKIAAQGSVYSVKCAQPQ